MQRPTKIRPENAKPNWIAHAEWPMRMRIRNKGSETIRRRWWWWQWWKKRAHIFLHTYRRLNWKFRAFQIKMKRERFYRFYIVTGTWQCGGKSSSLSFSIDVTLHILCVCLCTFIHVHLCHLLWNFICCVFNLKETSILTVVHSLVCLLVLLFLLPRLKGEKKSPRTLFCTRLLMGLFIAP